MKKQLNLYLPEELIAQVRQAALEADDRVSEHVAGILELHFKRRAAAQEDVAKLVEKLGAELVDKS